MMANPLEGLLEQGISTAVGYAIGGALTPVVDVATQPLKNAAWEEAVKAGDGLPLDPQTAATAEIRSGPGGYSGVDEAAKGGITADRYALLMGALQTPPGTSELLDLYRRGVLDRQTVHAALLRGGLMPEYVDKYLVLSEQILTVADLAMARQQGFIDDAELEQRAAAVGVPSADAQLYFKMAGLPPGITIGIELLRRGLIDEARFSEYVAEGHTKTKYTSDLLNLRYVPLSAATAVEAALRERIPKDQAQALAAEQGVSPDSFAIWLETVGRAMGIMEGLTLLNRGVITEANFREIVARSDVRTEYTDWLLELRTHYPSLFQLEAMIRSGSISDADARDVLHKEGYPAHLIDGMVAAGHAAKTAKAKDLNLSMVETLYVAGMESHDEAAKAIERLGYDPAETEELLKIMQARRVVAEIIHGTTMIRTRYVGWKIDSHVASQELAKFIPTLTDRNRLLDMWDAEREVSRPVLSRAQIAQARKYGIVSPEQAVTRWQAMGYSLEDAQIMDEIVAKGPEHPPPGPA